MSCSELEAFSLPIHSFANQAFAAGSPVPLRRFAVTIVPVAIQAERLDRAPAMCRSRSWSTQPFPGSRVPIPLKKGANIDGKIKENKDQERTAERTVVKLATPQ